MSAYSFVIGLMLVGQVGGGGGRYDAGVTNPFAPTAGATENPANGDTGSAGLVDVIQPPPADSPATPGGAAPASRGVNPYGTPITPLTNGNSKVGPPPGVSTPPAGNTGNSTKAPASTNPWVTNPPASASTPTGTSSNMKPAGMMRAMLTPPRDSRLTGYSLALADAVASAATRFDQTERVEAYWDLCSSTADYYLGLREQEELRRLRTKLPRVGPAWQQAESELAVRIGTSQAAALASQYRLASLLGTGLGSLPLPTDIPHCGDYHTRYDQIFAGRPSVEAQELAKLLPHRYAELKDAALAVTRTEDWLEATASRSDNTDGVETLRALELLALRRRAFVQIARDYNRRIARYTELSTPGQVNPDRLVSMLIKRTVPATATRSSAEPAPFNRQSQTAPSLPQTFAEEGWTSASDERAAAATRDESVQPASGEVEADKPSRQERSLLVNPQ